MVTSGATQRSQQEEQRKMCVFYLHNWARRKDFGFDIGVAGRTAHGCEEAHGVFGRNRLPRTRFPAHDDGLILLIPVTAEKKSFWKLISLICSLIVRLHHATIFRLHASASPSSSRRLDAGFILDFTKVINQFWSEKTLKIIESDGE